jgi:hypothetical protein
MRGKAAPRDANPARDKNRKRLADWKRDDDCPGLLAIGNRIADIEPQNYSV